MSHFTKIKTKLREKESLKQALQDLHLSVSEGELTVRGFGGKTERAEIVAGTGTDYDIGFRLEQEAYECVADWWGLSRYAHLEQTAFMNQVTQRYAYHETLQQIHNNPLLKNAEIEEHVTEEQVIELVVRWN